MAIFKQAAPLPIEPSAVSQGFEDFAKDPDFFTEQLIYELKKDKEYKLAQFCEKMHNQGYGFQQIRDMLSSVRSFLGN
jgi:hypothetical protein